MVELRDKRVLVMGLGVHGGGLGVTRFLCEQGADVTVTDLRTAELLAPTLTQLEGLPVRFVLGEHRDEDFRNTDLVIRNPGVPRESRYLQLAREAGAAIEMEMTLFFRLCPSPILGITGTKGKTTTTLLTGAMMREQYPDTVMAGNLRVSALEQLPKIGPDTPVVLELSSWQLEGLGEAQFSPRYACVTNISPDHLDRYGSMEAYIEAKEQIFLHQDRAGMVVLNASDAVVRGMERRAHNVVWFSANSLEDAELKSFADAQDRLCLWQDKELVWQRGAQREVVAHASDVQLVGRHNLANIAAAAALVLSYGVDPVHVRNAIRRFTGVPDRMELVREVAGVHYINDTTATTPTAAAAAVQSIDAPKVVIAGGADKKLDFADFADMLLQRAKAVVLLDGTATPKLIAALEAAQSAKHRPVITEPYNTLQDALDAAGRLAVAGDVVLLSPGCASFGMFKNEFDRGEQFRQLVRALP